MIFTKPKLRNVGASGDVSYTVLQFTLSLLLVLSLSTAKAQETFDAGGGEASGSGGSASYSIGQTFYHTNTGSDLYSAAEGVQQPFEISVITSANDAKDISLVYQVYPNPTRDVLNLKVENYYADELIYQLVNMNGEVLESNSFSGNTTSISMSGYVNAVYFLRLIDREKSIKVFKIIKQ
jgi:hypothetical protein